MQSRKSNPLHNPKTFSDSQLQEFEDVEGGVPLDDPIVIAREKKRKEALKRIQQNGNQTENKDAGSVYD